ncbi:hypothetical protein DQ238_01850 [Geodermatophilus sp. TF02-6]|uniref:GAF and ANTAR domain-containing protein n=1 Tax=Geodermatophilus sp. TF02-6 TaxID=2250575 RepID=UPI000DE91EBA|nr:GAF and ANTAR domain-containing protein [Geodermatophilus sp. TF02-6]RBY83829.1 hypothetical protein DQ238_01850 [Geodermatophilus sp. TF02-6]
MADVRPAPAGATWDIAVEGDPLGAALLALSRLEIDSLEFEDVLLHLAQLAGRAVPGADGAGLRLLDLSRPSSVVGTTAVACKVNAIESRLGEGPCTTALVEARTIRCNALSSERSWLPFRRRVRHLGIESVMSLPLRLSNRVLGSIGVYAGRRDAFDEHAARVGELFTTSAAVTVHNAQVLAAAQRLGVPPRTPETDGPVVERALGVIISRTGDSPVEAFERLLLVSHRTHRRVSAVASQVVHEAERAARARRAGRPTISPAHQHVDPGRRTGQPSV